MGFICGGLTEVGVRKEARKRLWKRGVPLLDQLTQHAVSPDMAEMQPINPVVGPMLNDLYQITMAYGYWKSGKQ